MLRMDISLPMSNFWWVFMHLYLESKVIMLQDLYSCYYNGCDYWKIYFWLLLSCRLSNHWRRKQMRQQAMKSHSGITRQIEKWLIKYARRKVKVLKWTQTSYLWTKTYGVSFVKLSAAMSRCMRSTYLGRSMQNLCNNTMVQQYRRLLRLVLVDKEYQEHHIIPLIWRSRKRSYWKVASQFNLWRHAQYAMLHVMGKLFLLNM